MNSKTNSFSSLTGLAGASLDENDSRYAAHLSPSVLRFQSTDTGICSPIAAAHWLMGVTHARTAVIFTGHSLTANRMSAIPTIHPLSRRTHRAAVTSVLHHAEITRLLSRWAAGQVAHIWTCSLSRPQITRLKPRGHENTGQQSPHDEQ